MIILVSNLNKKIHYICNTFNKYLINVGSLIETIIKSTGFNHESFKYFNNN